MPEIGTSGLMSGEGKRACWCRALPRLYPPVAESSPAENCETNPAPPESSIVSIKIRTRHPRRRSSFQRAHREFRSYLAASMHRTSRRVSYNENLLQATRANDTL